MNRIRYSTPANVHYIKVPSSIYELDSMTSAEKLLLGKIMNIEETGGDCYYRNKTLAKMIGMSEKSVKDAINCLDFIGFVEIYHNINGRMIPRQECKRADMQATTRYIYLSSWQKIEYLISRYDEFKKEYNNENKHIVISENKIKYLVNGNMLLTEPTVKYGNR